MFKKSALLITLLACSTAALAFDWHTPELTSRLWKISKNGQPDSHIIGTYHIGPYDAKLPAKVTDILKNSELLFTEISFPGDKPFLSFSDMTILKWRAFDFSSGRTLSDKIGAENAERLKTIITENHGPQAAWMLTYMEPWAVFLAGGIDPLPEGYYHYYGVDNLLVQAAKKHKISRDSLEYYSDRIPYFKKIPLSRMIEQIEYGSRFQPEISKELKKISDLYYKGKYQSLIRHLDKQPSFIHKLPPGFYQYWQNWMEQDILTKRNQKWMPKLLRILPKQKTLVAVGAAHLVDDSGLILQLRKHGYTVEPVAE